MDSSRPQELFEANFPLIQEVLGKACGLRRLPPDEREDFTSYALLRLIQNDYGVFRQFTGRCSLKTYLVTVVHRMFLDYRNQQWGKWRPSVRARRLGDTAVRLETLIARDGLSPDEAIESLAGQNGGLDRAELARLANLLRPRFRRRMEGGEQLSALVSEERADRRVRERERRAAARQVQAALRQALGALSREERLILDLHYRKGITIRQIAGGLGLESKPLYRRIERCLRRLRSAIESQDVTREAALETVGSF